MRLRKPVIAMNMMNLHDDDPLIQSKIPNIVKNSIELIPTIKRCLETKNTIMLDKGESFAKKEIGVADGFSAKRITELILSLKKNLDS